MKEIKLQDKTYLFVEVPDDACNFHFDNILNEIDYSVWEDRKHYKDFITIGQKCQIISTTKDITESQAKSIVEYQYIKNQPFIAGREYWYKNYKNLRTGWDFTFFTAKESLQSLIQSLGLNTTKNYLILQKL
jgi:hypothetical protein